MTKHDRLALLLNVDLAAMRGDQIGKILTASRQAANLESLRDEIDKIHNLYWRLECDREDRFRKEYDSTLPINGCD
jgi:hypothetical protein